MSVHSEIENPVGNAAAHAMTLDEAIAHAEEVADRCDTSCGREHRQLADWLKELRDVKSRNVGNAAALREALNKVGNAAAWIAERCNDQQTAKYMNDIIAIVQTAIAKPARNCDKYDNFNDALRQFVKERPDTKKIDEQGRSVATAETYCVFANWLITPAAEREGEGDA